MNLRASFNLLVLCCLLLALAGCASSPRSSGGAETEDAIAGDLAVPDPNKPRLFFSGGDVQQVRGAALGAAVTQGWKVQETSGDSLILQRNLDSSAAEALAPGASRGPLPPVVEVRADFFPRGGGVETQLGAQVITQRGTPKEARQDYTDTYRNELNHSLAMLQNAWHETGPRIANALPPAGGFKDSTSAEGQVASTSAPETFDSGLPSGQNGPETPASSQLAATEAEKEPEFSTAATWALPAGAAATAAATAQARASALPAAPASVGPAPVVSRTLAPNPRLIQSPPPPSRMASASPQTATTKVASGTPSTTRVGQSANTSPPSVKAGSSSVTSPVKATPTATKTTMTSGSAATPKPAVKTTTSANTATATNKKAPTATTKTSVSAATGSAAKTKTPTTSTKTPKPNDTPAPVSSASKAPAKTTPVSQQPAKSATTSTKTASASSTSASGTTSTKTAGTAPKANTQTKTTGATTGAKKPPTAKEN